MISVKGVQKAAAFLKGRVIHTPLVYSRTFSKLSGASVYLKLENLQQTGSFKLRGATWKMHSLSDTVGPGGVIAASAGNHAQGVALAARRAGLPATIIMPERASISKQEATRGYGGKVILEGQSIGESIQRAREMAEAGLTFIHPYDDEEIITGQGTIALEVLEDLADIDSIIVPVGGGGLISGIASVFRSASPGTRVIGVQAEACPAAKRACMAGHVLRIEAQRSIADGITVKQLGERTFSIIRECVDDIVLVEEDRIAAAMLALLERKRILAEGAGAVPVAALLDGQVPISAGRNVVLVISGGNVDSPLLDRIIRKGLVRSGRVMRFSVCLDDSPGTLAHLLTIISAAKANVLQIYHNRIGKDLPIHLSRVELELETRGPEHIEEISRELTAAGYQTQAHSQDLFSC